MSYIKNENKQNKKHFFTILNPFVNANKPQEKSKVETY